MISCVGQCFARGYICATSTFWFGHVNYLPANTALLQESFAVSSQILAVMTVERSIEGGRQTQVMAHESRFQSFILIPFLLYHL